MGETKTNPAPMQVRPYGDKDGNSYRRPGSDLGNIVQQNMFGPLKRLFSRPASPAPAEAVSSVPIAPLIPAPVAAPAFSTPPPPPTGESIQVPFQDIVARLPATITPLLASSFNGMFALPVQTALAQLPTGAVRITLAELRRGIPPGTIAENPSLDSTLIDLPLPRILAAMNPALLARRPGQKKVTVSEEITGIFGTKEKAAFASPSPAPVAPPPKPVAQPFIIPAPIPMPIPAPIAMPVAQAAPIILPPPPQGENVLTVPLSALGEFWPAEVRQEITASGWSEAVVSLPMDRLETSMKAGRVSFSWGEVIGWLNVAPPSVPSVQSATTLEFPLKVIAPLFMSRRKVSVPQKKTTVGENIPDLFAGGSKPAPAPTAPALVSNEWSPQQVVLKINALPNVAGSLIVTKDGLLVAGSVPAPLKSETMAAFLAQLFARGGQASNEMQLGPLTCFTLWAGQHCCAIFKSGTLYMAVLSRAGDPLPDMTALQRTASELAQRNP
jgi:predicted regulator of Ras-like GTPase activity (Roadblock/LC7/MglB family)